MPHYPLTPEQRLAFCERGYLLLQGALNKSQVEPIKAYVLNELNRLKVWSSGKVLSAPIKKLPAFQQINKLSGLIKQDNLHSKVISKDTLGVIHFLAGMSLFPAQSQFLISLPDQGDWTINGLNWHTDISPSGHYPIPGIQAFVLIDDVKPHGGATLAIAGSHLLVGHDKASREVREILRRSDDYESVLRSRNMSILEMSGRAGDVYLMNMGLLHTPSFNSTSRIRMMATVRYLPGATREA
jgi:hypothetical protein